MNHKKLAGTFTGVDDILKKLKAWIINFLKIGLAVGLIYWMYRKGALDLDSLQQLATPGLITVFLGITFIQVFANNYRWLFLLRGQGLDSTVSHTLPLSFIGIFFNFAMPGGVGGDVVKGYYLLQDFPQKKLPAAMSIFMDRMVGFFAMITMAVVAMLVNFSEVRASPHLSVIAVGVVALFLVFNVFYIISLSTRFARRYPLDKFFDRVPGGGAMRSIYQALHAYRKNRAILAQALAISLFSQILMVLFVYLVGQNLGFVDLPLSSYFFLVPIGVVVMALPISPAGIGVGQAAFLYLFKLYMGQETQLGPTAVTAMQISQVAIGIIGAVFYLKRGKPREMEQNAVAS